MIPVLARLRAPLPGYHHTALYGPPGGLPWYRECAEIRDTQEQAFADARRWARDYEARDRYGNMAHALGVVATASGWRGVVNYFHSNT